MTKKHREGITEQYSRQRWQLEAIKGEQTLVELAERSRCTRIRSRKWKKQLLGSAAEVFEKGKPCGRDTDVKERHGKIGQLTMENDFLWAATT